MVNILDSGNTWGCCPDGRCGTGCGPQEQFRSCSDISIKSGRFEEFDGDVMEEIPLDGEM